MLANGCGDHSTSDVAPKRSISMRTDACRHKAQVKRPEEGMASKDLQMKQLLLVSVVRDNVGPKSRA